ncbi:N-terminal acetyltransferase A complex subunit Nat1p [[Candida] anglica]
MVVRRTPVLSSKEDTAFREALSLYDSKQYKKALKLVEQTLKKSPNHAESLALKGCINHFVSTKAEADLYVRKGLARAPGNHLVNHLAGIYFRNVEDYAEAAKWYKAAIDNGSQNKQILRDLATMQVHNRDYKNLKDSRQSFLEEQPGFRANWTGNAVAQHLNKNYSGAISTLSKIEGLIKEHLSASDMVEHSECLLYKNSIMSEAGDFEKALKCLNHDEPDIKDKLSVLEYRARYLLLLGEKKEAALVYRRLLQRNPDNSSYYTLLEVAMETSEMSVDIRLKLYDKLARFYPRSDPPKFLPLTFLPASHPEFLNKAKEYVLSQLQRGIPATFVNIKPVYKDKAKMKVIEELVLKFYKEEVSKLIPTVTVWTRYFLAQHYLYLNDLTNATKYIDQALEHSPTLVELYIVKARILKHLGQFEQAAEAMNEGRELDLQDRFINSKATKYYFRANKVDKAIDTISLFTKLEDGAVNGCKDLHLMQVNWVLIESAEAYSRLYHEFEAKLREYRASVSAGSTTEPVEEDGDENSVESIENELIENIQLYKGLALKRYHAVIKVFDIFYNDQLDFHSYCLRRGTPRDYVETLKWEDNIHGTPIYSRVLKGLSQIYLEIYEEQEASKKLKNESGDLAGSNKPKKNGKKQKKAKAQVMKKKEELVAKVASVADDQDPLGSNLLSGLITNSHGKVLDNLFELFKPLLTEAKSNKLTWELAYELYLRQGKYILAMQAIKSLNSILTKYKDIQVEEINTMVNKLASTARSDPDANAAIVKVVEKGLSTSFPEYFTV